MASAAGLHTRSGFDTGDSLVAAPSAEDEPRVEVLYGDREDMVAALAGIRRGGPCGAPEPSSVYVNWPRRNRRPGTERIGVTVRHDFETTPRLPFPGTPPVITLVLSIPVNAFAVWSIT